MRAKSCRKNKVFVHLFQKVVVSRGNAFGRLPQKAKYLVIYQCIMDESKKLQEK